jgi:DNA-binding response OmpR family regulator
MRILVVEDEQAVAGIIKEGLESDHYGVDVAGDGERAKSLLGGADYDLVILDLVLPKVDGYQVLNHLRRQKPSLPVLILSGRADVEDRVKGLDLGADDYLPKPFSYPELSARVRALLRRSLGWGETVLRVGDLEMDRAERMVTRGGRHIELTPHEFALLECLMRNAGRCVTRDMLIEHVWASSLDAPTNVVEVYINYVRHKVDQDFKKKLIHTVRGVGYQLGGEVKPDTTA